MKVLLLGPCSLQYLNEFLDDDAKLPGFGNQLGRGGVQVALLASGLVKQGHHVTVLTFDKIKEVTHITNKKISFICVPYSKPIIRVLSFYYFERQLVKKLLEKCDFDILHAHWTYEYALTALNVSLDCIITVRDWAPDVIANLDDKIYRYFRCIINNYVLRRAQYLIANSKYIADKLETKGLRCSIIPNMFKMTSKPTKKASKFSIVSVGNGNKGKNLKTLYIAVKRLISLGYDISLTLIGPTLDNQHPLYLQAQYDLIADHIFMLGELSNMETVGIIASADLYVQPSLHESFGNPIVEAMANHTLCVVAQGSGGPEWIVDYGKCGIVLDMQDEKMLVKWISKYIEKFEKLDDIISLAYLRFHKVFEFDANVLATINYYEQMIINDNSNNTSA